MKNLQFLLAAGLVLAASGGANAGSSFDFAGAVDGVPSMVELGKPAADAGKASTPAPDPAPAAEKQAEVPQTGANTVGDKQQGALADGQNAIEKKAGSDKDAASSAKALIDKTVTSSAAASPKPFFESSPFSATELRH